jgi:hypothetical protein
VPVQATVLRFFNESTLAVLSGLAPPADVALLAAARPFPSFNSLCDHVASAPAGSQLPQLLGRYTAAALEGRALDDVIGQCEALSRRLRTALGQGAGDGPSVPEPPSHGLPTSSSLAAAEGTAAALVDPGSHVSVASSSPTAGATGNAADQGLMSLVCKRSLTAAYMRTVWGGLRDWPSLGTETRTHAHMHTQTDRQTDRHRERQTESQADRHRQTHTRRHT